MHTVEIVAQIGLELSGLLFGLDCAGGSETQGVYDHQCPSLFDVLIRLVCPAPSGVRNLPPEQVGHFQDAVLHVVEVEEEQGRKRGKHRFC